MIISKKKLSDYAAYIFKGTFLKKWKYSLIKIA